MQELSLIEVAARKNLTQLPRTREKIRASMLVNRLMSHVLGKCDMTPSQVRAAHLVLRKILPDLKAVKVEYETQAMRMPSARRAIDMINTRSPRRKKPKARGKNRLVRQRKRSARRSKPQRRLIACKTVLMTVFHDTHA
jgi:hypothetical protein